MVDENAQENNDKEIAGGKTDELQASSGKCLSRLTECGFLEVESNNGEGGVFTYRLTGVLVKSYGDSLPASS